MSDDTEKISLHTVASLKREKTTADENVENRKKLDLLRQRNIRINCQETQNYYWA